MLTGEMAKVLLRTSFSDDASDAEQKTAATDLVGGLFEVLFEVVGVVGSVGGVGVEGTQINAIPSTTS